MTEGARKGFGYASPEPSAPAAGEPLRLQPGQHWDGEEVVNNSAYLSRVARPRVSAAERFFSRAVFAAEQAARQGFTISADTMNMLNPELPLRQLRELAVTDKFLTALDARGIATASTTGLEPHQLAAIAIYLDTTVAMTQAQKLKAAGVTPAQWAGWMRQAAFADRISVLSEEQMAALTPLALQRLGENVDAGKLDAIKFQLEITGRHDPRMPGVDVSLLLQQIFAILDEEIPDARVLRRIGEKVQLTLGAGSPGMAGQAATLGVGSGSNGPSPMIIQE